MALVVNNNILQFVLVLKKQTQNCILCTIALSLSACSVQTAGKEPLRQIDRYQDSLETYIGQNISLLVRELGPPSTIVKKDANATLMIWESNIPYDREFWWVGAQHCKVRTVFETKTRILLSVKAEGNACVPIKDYKEESSL